ncbi:spore germination protein [Paenibacillus sp. LMG 31460]|uniref:Spore germination protein n=1 Tax=Paenibacillus germinis TaxID=2654979 RepID=A0ABX1YY01_9BACL|nr:spore germination protein [Paenibacillus germinis]NOU84706.1 spore germination protein [Paenibacillus germinis]
MQNMKNDIPADIIELEQLLEEALNGNPNLIAKYVVLGQQTAAIYYIETLVDQDLLQRDIIQPLLTFVDVPSINETERFPVAGIVEVKVIQSVAEMLLLGWVYLHSDDSRFNFLLNVYRPPNCSFSKAEIESQVFGPQIAFNEILRSNIALLQMYLPSPNLCQENLEVGVEIKTQVAMFYIKNLTDNELVKRVRDRINSLEIDGVVSSAQLVQLIEDNKFTIFPQFVMTERIDRTSYSLSEGKIVLFVSGSPFAIVCPSTMMDFFSSAEDHQVRWNMATFFRLLRVGAMVLSLLFTPIYVAALTFHYEIIPSAMVVPLAESRTRVPFPPLMEALFLEITIELLREAGARLPTKIGQTIGIVGGIVIGQAAVQAGFTSNILIIIVALGTLASFITPIYLMGITIRIIRYPIIILAGFYGGIGIMIGICFLVIHLLRLTSLGQPYLYPLYPFRKGDLKDSILRLPFSFLRERSMFTHGDDTFRFVEQETVSSHGDIDE